MKNRPFGFDGEMLTEEQIENIERALVGLTPPEVSRIPQQANEADEVEDHHADA